MSGNLRATLIYNPLAGPAEMEELLRQIAADWRLRGWRVEMRATQAAGHAVELAREAAAQGQQLVFAAGGDGTLGDVANGLAGTETIMAPLPVGTANSFARELHLPLPSLINPNKIFEAARALAKGRVQRLDLGYTCAPNGSDADGRYWLLWTGTGADGFLVNELEPRPKWSKRIGPASYVLQGVPVIPRFSHVTADVDVDGRTFSGDFVLVLISNCRRYAGGFVTLSPQARLDDKQFEVWLFRGRGLADMSRLATHVWLGDHVAQEDVVRLRGNGVTVRTAAPTPYQTDGEPAGKTPLTCEIRPHALRLLAPNTAPPDLFLEPGERLPF